MKPPAGLDDAFEDDPHGVRELLSSLPDPGPMPADVVARISGALATQQAARTGSPDRDAQISRMLRELPDPGPMPAHIAARISGALAAERAVPNTAVDRGADTSSDADAEQLAIRELLRAQPDPGPMPVRVREQIENALAREQHLRSGRADNVTPLVGRPTAGETLSARSSSAAGPGATAAAPRRRTMMRLVGGLAAAAVAGIVAVGGYQAMNQQSAPAVGAVPTSSDSSLLSKVHVTSSDKNYTAANFASDAGMLAKSDTGAGVSPADAAALGPVATPSGALKCAAVIGQSVLDDSSKITVDIARYEGKPALVVVVTRGETSTAWVLSRQCDQGQPPVAGPTTTT